MGSAFSRGSADHLRGSHYAGESCAESFAEVPPGELRAELVDAKQPLHLLCHGGRLIPLPRPDAGQRVRVCLGGVAVYLEADGTMALHDSGALEEDPALEAQHEHGPDPKRHAQFGEP